MSSSRIAGVATRSARTLPRRHVQYRPRVQQRSYADAPGSNSGGGMTPIVGGIVGGGVVLAAGYGYYHFSGAKTAVQTMKSAKVYFQQGKEKIRQQTPEPNEAIEWLHNTALAYAGFIPGARGYVDTAFKDIESVRNKHHDKVDSIVREAYDELKEVTQEGELNIETLGKVWSVLQDKINKIGELAGDAVEDILNNHPEIKEKVGGNIDQFKQLQDQYGPKVKEEVDKTWGQISDIVKKGVSVNTATDIQNIIQEKTKVIREMGDKLYTEGLDKVKPYLEKSPKVKELVEKNEDVLKQSNLSELWDTIKQAVNSGNTEDIENYIRNAADNAKSQGKKFGVDVEKYFQGIPGSKEIMTKVQKLQEVGKKHGPEAEKLFNNTIEEIKQVLQKKSQEAEKLAESAKKETKK